MRTIPYPPVALTDRIELVGAPSWTSPKEVRAMIVMIEEVAPGAGILEIGCNEGETTREFAAAFPRVLVHAVDWLGEPTMVHDQRHEQPIPAKMGWRAFGCPNVRFHDRSAGDALLPPDDVRAVFIDGDHSYPGVKRDTELVLDRFAKLRQNWIIFWHDANPDAPHWIGVRRFLEELGAEWPVAMIDGTRLAVLGQRFI